MGRETRTISVSGSVSRHNSQQDKDDDQAMEDLRMEIEALVASDPNYARVVYDVSCPS